mmetsp:Transcript_11538/g.29349  ORF Transcript_11538/g.29349 Transcript_11538/m.29349 type:complete len:226 (-) Transcript_11538:717-1394(-)
MLNKLNRGLSQRVNLSGVRLAFQILTTRRRLALPHIAVQNIGSVNWGEMKRAGFEGCIFDKDNTLTLPYGDSLHPSVKDSMEECGEIFKGNVALLSNSAGLEQYDADGSEADMIEKKLGIPVLRHRKKKPEGEPEVLVSHFGVPVNRLVMIGDRTFTDIAYGNALGMLTVKCQPFTPVGENIAVRIARWFEDRLVHYFRSRGCAPLPQETIGSWEVPELFVKGRK